MHWRRLSNRARRWPSKRNQWRSPRSEADVLHVLAKKTLKAERMEILLLLLRDNGDLLGEALDSKIAGSSVAGKLGVYYMLDPMPP